MQVTNLLALLKLAPAVLDAIRALAPGTPERLVAERKLRPLTALSHRRQVQELPRLVSELLQGREVA